MNPEALFSAKYLQIPAVGLWTFAGPGSMVGIVDHFLVQTGLESKEVLERVEGFEPMVESIKRFKENYGSLFPRIQPIWFQDVLQAGLFLCLFFKMW